MTTMIGTPIDKSIIKMLNEAYCKEYFWQYERNDVTFFQNLKDSYGIELMYIFGREGPKSFKVIDEKKYILFMLRWS